VSSSSIDRVAIALLALVVASSCVLALGQGLRHVVDAGFGSGDPRLLNAALAAVVGVAVVLAAATWVRFYLMMSVGERIVADLRNAVFAHVLTLSPAFCGFPQAPMTKASFTDMQAMAPTPLALSAAAFWM